jgi:hypothetical protein
MAELKKEVPFEERLENLPRVLATGEYIVPPPKFVKRSLRIRIILGVLGTALLIQRVVIGAWQGGCMALKMYLGW